MHNFTDRRNPSKHIPSEFFTQTKCCHNNCTTPHQLRLRLHHNKCTDGFKTLRRLI